MWVWVCSSVAFAGYMFIFNGLAIAIVIATLESMLTPGLPNLSRIFDPPPDGQILESLVLLRVILHFKHERIRVRAGPRFLPLVFPVLALFPPVLLQSSVGRELQPKDGTGGLVV